MKRRQSRNSSEGGNGRKGRAGARKDEEPEIVETPTCPILKKIAQAFVYAKTAVPCSRRVMAPWGLGHAASEVRRFLTKY